MPADTNHSAFEASLNQVFSSLTNKQTMASVSPAMDYTAHANGICLTKDENPSELRLDADIMSQQRNSKQTKMTSLPSRIPSEPWPTSTSDYKFFSKTGNIVGSNETQKKLSPVALSSTSEGQTTPSKISKSLWSNPDIKKIGQVTVANMRNTSPSSPISTTSTSLSSSTCSAISSRSETSFVESASSETEQPTENQLGSQVVGRLVMDGSTISDSDTDAVDKALEASKQKCVLSPTSSFDYLTSSLQSLSMKSKYVDTGIHTHSCADAVSDSDYDADELEIGRTYSNNVVDYVLDECESETDPVHTGSTSHCSKIAVNEGGSPREGSIESPHSQRSCIQNEHDSMKEKWRKMSNSPLPHASSGNVNTTQRLSTSPVCKSTSDVDVQNPFRRSRHLSWSSFEEETNGSRANDGPFHLHTPATHHSQTLSTVPATRSNMIFNSHHCNKVGGMDTFGSFGSPFTDHSKLAHTRSFNNPTEGFTPSSRPGPIWGSDSTPSLSGSTTSVSVCGGGSMDVASSYMHSSAVNRNCSDSAWSGEVISHQNYSNPQREPGKIVSNAGSASIGNGTSTSHITVSPTSSREFSRSTSVACVTPGSMSQSTGGNQAPIGFRRHNTYSGSTGMPSSSMQAQHQQKVWASTTTPATESESAKSHSAKMNSLSSDSSQETYSSDLSPYGNSFIQNGGIMQDCCASTNHGHDMYSQGRHTSTHNGRSYEPYTCILGGYSSTTNTQLPMQLHSFQHQNSRATRRHSHAVMPPSAQAYNDGGWGNTGRGFEQDLHSSHTHNRSGGYNSHYINTGGAQESHRYTRSMSMTNNGQYSHQTQQSSSMAGFGKKSASGHSSGYLYGVSGNPGQANKSGRGGIAPASRSGSQQFGRSMSFIQQRSAHQVYVDSNQKGRTLGSRRSSGIPADISNATRIQMSRARRGTINDRVSTMGHSMSRFNDNSIVWCDIDQGIEMASSASSPFVKGRKVLYYYSRRTNRKTIMSLIEPSYLLGTPLENPEVNIGFLTFHDCVELRTLKTGEILTRNQRNNLRKRLATTARTIVQVDVPRLLNDFTDPDCCPRTAYHHSKLNAYLVSPAVIQVLLCTRENDIGAELYLGHTIQVQTLFDLAKNESATRPLADFIRSTEMNNVALNINIRDFKGMCPIHYAAKAGLTATINILIREGADVNVVDKSEQSPLHYAIYNGHNDVQFQLLRAGAKLDTRNVSGNTLLHVAAYHNQLEIAEAILDKAPELLFLRNHKFNSTPLECAGHKGLHEMETLLGRKMSIMSSMDMSTSVAATISASENATTGVNIYSLNPGPRGLNGTSNMDVSKTFTVDEEGAEECTSPLPTLTCTNGLASVQTTTAEGVVTGLDEGETATLPTDGRSCEYQQSVETSHTDILSTSAITKQIRDVDTSSECVLSLLRNTSLQTEDIVPITSRDP